MVFINVVIFFKSNDSTLRKARSNLCFFCTFWEGSVLNLDSSQLEIIFVYLLVSICNFLILRENIIQKLTLLDRANDRWQFFFVCHIVLASGRPGYVFVFYKVKTKMKNAHRTQCDFFSSLIGFATLRASRSSTFHNLLSHCFRHFTKRKLSNIKYVSTHKNICG